MARSTVNSHAANLYEELNMADSALFYLKAYSELTLGLMLTKQNITVRMLKNERAVERMEGVA